MYLEIHKNFPKVYKRKWHSRAAAQRTAGRSERSRERASKMNFALFRIINLETWPALKEKNLSEAPEKKRGKKFEAKFRKKFIFAYTKRRGQGNSGGIGRNSRLPPPSDKFHLKLPSKAHVHVLLKTRLPLPS